ncbi:MAG TPA: extracellular solute-binding protein [Candidatus Binatia bacterium]|nr:extracellular solute-binding protein [Candidatus Binatia bacterium]
MATLSLLGAGCSGGPDAIVLAVALLPAELPVYRSVIGEFERRSGRRVMIVPQQYSDIRRALGAESKAGRGTLDLVELDVYSLAVAAGDVAELDEQALAREIDALDENALAAGRFGGLRFLPHRLSWQAMIYDHEAIASPPASWSELVEVARAHSGRIAIKGALYEGLACDVLPLVWAAGASGEDFGEEGAEAALGMLAELAPHLHPHSETFKEAAIAEAMARGEIVLHWNWPAVMSLYQSQGLAPQRIRSAPLPAGPRGRATVLGGGYVAVPSAAPHRDDALALLRFLLSREVQQRLATELGWFSGRRDVAPPTDNTALDGFVAMRPHVRPRPERKDYPRLSRAWQQAARAVLFENVAPAKALATARESMKEN